MKRPIVAIVGRPNVGKSTLFNCLGVRDKALVHPTPGLTRDVRRAPARLGNLSFDLLDTAGLDLGKNPTDLADRLNDLTLAALPQADVVLFVVDGQAGLLPPDYTIAKQLRPLGKPVAVVVNKLDVAEAGDTLAEAARLGFDTLIGLSAAHRQGLDDLEEALAMHINASDEPEHVKPLPRIVVMGQPNVGKSTLVNALLGERKMLAGPEAGLTRESIGHQFGNFEVVDTPGLRKKNKIVQDIEQQSVGSALHAIERSDALLVLVDATHFNPDRSADGVFHHQDAALISHAAHTGRVFIVLVNKWDAVQDRDKARHAVELDLKHRAAHMKRVPVLYISARLRRGLPDVMPLVKELLAKANQKIPTGKLNQFLSEVLSKNPPPLSKGRPVRLKFITQVGTNPPTFALWGNRTAAIPDSYKRYLTNRMADALGLDGISIRITFRGTENPYAAKGQQKKPARQGGATRRKIHSTPNKRRKG